MKELPSNSINLVDAIRSAREQIDLSDINLTDHTVLKELKRAAQRDVMIRIIIDQPLVFESLLVKKILSALMDKNVYIKVSKRKRLEKKLECFIFDRRSAIIKLNPLQFNSQKETFIEDEFVILHMSNKFERDWESAVDSAQPKGATILLVSQLHHQKYGGTL